jgi:hypothetical protein
MLSLMTICRRSHLLSMRKAIGFARRAGQMTCINGRCGLTYYPPPASSADSCPIE